MSSALCILNRVHDNHPPSHLANQNHELAPPSTVQIRFCRLLLLVLSARHGIACTGCWHCQSVTRMAFNSSMQANLNMLFFQSLLGSQAIIPNPVNSHVSLAFDLDLSKTLGMYIWCLRFQEPVRTFRAQYPVGSTIRFHAGSRVDFKIGNQKDENGT